VKKDEMRRGKIMNRREMVPYCENKDQENSKKKKNHLPNNDRRSSFTIVEVLF
jgi:hypothetical protein